jgi:hypothetical protein
VGLGAVVIAAESQLVPAGQKLPAGLRLAFFIWFIIDLDLVFLNQLFELFAELEQQIFDADVFRTPRKIARSARRREVQASCLSASRGTASREPGIFRCGLQCGTDQDLKVFC